MSAIACPKVSVCVITYNHGRYIRQCLQGIVAQKTSFPFEVIVGDDYSTDDTPKIIREFASRYPQLIVPILNEKKIGGTRNYVSTHLKARGEYVAHMDGDDLAFPGKLQRQMEYLDSHEHLALVWHDMDIVNDACETTGRQHRYIDKIIDTTKITRSDILRFGSLGAASSVMYRRNFAKFLVDITSDTLDYYFAAKFLEFGNGVRLNEVLGGYRFDPNTVTLSKTKSRYFSSSPMRQLYARHLMDLNREGKRFRDDIFLNAVFNFLVELRFLRPSVFSFFCLLTKTMSVSAICQLPNFLLKAFRLRIR